MLKMWRFSLCILCALSLFLCGCQAPHIPEQTTETEEHPPLSQGLPEPEHHGNTLVSYDPGREIYFFGCENVNATFYLENSMDIALNFLLISKKQLNEEAIQVSLPIVNSYTYSITDLGEGTSFRETFYSALEEGQQLGEVSSELWLPYYVYQGYIGVDFAQLGALWQKYLNEGQKRSEAGEINASEAELAAYNEFVAMRDSALPGFKALLPDQTREFFVYHVSIMFDRENAVDEVLSGFTVTVDGIQYTPFTGEIHLVPSARPASYTEQRSMLFHMLQTPATGLYGDGKGRLVTHMFAAEEDITLTEYIVREEQFSVLDLVVTISSRNGNSASFYWDGTSPIDVLAGDNVSVELIFHNQNMENFSYFQKLHPELVCAKGSQSYSEVVEISCSSIFIMNYHELYAIIFDGVDMESYYRDYHYPLFEDWRAEYAK